MITSILAGLAVAVSTFTTQVQIETAAELQWRTQVEAVADCRSVVGSVIRDQDYDGSTLEVQYLGWEDDVRVARVFDGIAAGESPLVTVTAICGRGW